MKNFLLAALLMFFTSVSVAGGLTVTGLVGKTIDVDTLQSVNIESPLVGGVSLMSGQYDLLPIHGIVTLLSDRQGGATLDLGFRSYVGLTRTVSLFGELGMRQLLDFSGFDLVGGLKTYGVLGAELAMTDTMSLGLQARRGFVSNAVTVLLGTVSVKF